MEIYKYLLRVSLDFTASGFVLVQFFFLVRSMVLQVQLSIVFSLQVYKAKKGNWPEIQVTTCRLVERKG